MTDVLIRHCTLRIVRRDGWSWGAEPRRLLRGAVEALPALLAERLAEALPPGLEGEVRQPLVLRVPVREKDLLRMCGNELEAGGVSGLALAERLVEALDAALPGALSPVEAAPLRAEPREADSQDGAVLLPAFPRDHLAARLLAWHREGTLGALLALLPEEVLSALCRHILAPPSGSLAAEGPLAAFLSRRLEELQREKAPFSLAALALQLAAGAAAEHGILLGGPALAAAIHHLLPAGTAPEGGTPRQVAAAPFGAAAAEAPPASPLETGVPASLRAALPAAGPQPLAEGEVQVASALPWLLLGPLARLGYLDTLAAALDLAGLAAQAPCFAAGLAMKVLPAPVRGWRRGPDAALTAAAFAGLAEPLPEPHLARFARAVAPGLDLPDAELTRATLAGREPEAALLLLPVAAEAGGGLLLFDPAGIFPVAWRSGPTELAGIVAAAGSPPLLVPAPAAAPDLLGGIDAAGLAFLTPAPPGRGEPWTRAAAGLGRLWCNRPPRASAALRREVARLDDTAGRAEELARDLALRRPAVAVATGSALDRSLTLAAATALGTIAWTLWREREPTDPLLALERFASLDAHVRFDRRSLRVRLPLGKRHRDLYEHGLLASVRGVPWLGGRVVEISGG